MEVIRDTILNKKLDAKFVAMVLNSLPEGDKREVMGYIKCMFFTNRVPDMLNTDKKEISELAVKEAI